MLRPIPVGDVDDHLAGERLARVGHRGHRAAVRHGEDNDVARRRGAVVTEGFLID
jgi:hypothetical protein